MAFSTVQLGRLALTELPQRPATEQSSAMTLDTTGRLLHVAGQEAYPLSTTARMAALHDDLQGLVKGGYLVPVTFGDKSDRNGFYTVYSAQSGLQNWNGETITDDWAVDLQRVGTDLEIDFESRLTGPTTVNTTLALTGAQWNSPPSGHYAFYGLGSSPSITRACSDGPAQTVYIPGGLASPPTAVRWGCPVGSYGNGRTRFLDSSGLERSGIDFSVGSVTSWTLTNGMVRVQPGATGAMLDIACWSGGAWQTKGWDLSLNAVALSGWSSVNVLRNDYETVIVRLVKDASGRVLIDLTLRRGSRFVEVYVTTPASATIKAVRHTTEAGTAGTGTVTATANDAAGNQYTLGSAHTTTADTTNGGLSSTGSATADFYIGAVVGGTGSGALDNSSSLMQQYLGRRGEYVQAVRR
jgi:hypothetical protein